MSQAPLGVGPPGRAPFELKEAASPLRHGGGEAMPFGLIHAEVAGAEATERSERLAQRVLREASILLAGQRTEAVQAEPVDQRVDIDELARLRPIEQASSLSAANSSSEASDHTDNPNSADAGVGSEIDLCRLVTIAHRQASEPVTDPLTHDTQACRDQRSLHGLGEHVDVVG